MLGTTVERETFASALIRVCEASAFNRRLTCLPATFSNGLRINSDRVCDTAL